jgi:hypothetical protein
LDNIVAVVTGRYSSVVAQRWLPSEIAGGLVAWIIRLPTEPIWIVLRRYRGPGYRALINTRRVVHLSASQTGNLVRDAVDEGEQMLLRMGRLLS